MLLSRRQNSLVVLIVLLLVQLCWQGNLVSAYRHGEVIVTNVRWDNEMTDALRAQMPLFAVNTVVTYNHKEGFKQKDPTSFSLVLDHTRSLPSVAIAPTSTLRLYHWKITFVYTQDDIQTITSATPEYRTINPEGGGDDDYPFTVMYEWVKEPDVLLGAGQGIMLVTCFVVCCALLLQLCGSIDPPTEEVERYTRTQDSSGGNTALHYEAQRISHKDW